MMRTDELRLAEVVPWRDADAVPRLVVPLTCVPGRVAATVAWRSLRMGREPGVPPPHEGLPMPGPGK